MRIKCPFCPKRWTGWQLLHRSASGLMDESIPAEQIKAVETVLEDYRRQGLDFHALRTRQAGMRAFVTLHVLVPGAWTVQQRSEEHTSELQSPKDLVCR